MTKLTFDDLVSAAEQLQESEQLALIRHLQALVAATKRERLMLEYERRKRSSGQENIDSLRTRYGSADAIELDDKIFNDYLREVERESEQEGDAGK
ncbi:MAG: hypothetical protein U0528_18810 [Anaerolineae bacterium]|nr:hypothetical protein [Anaerolineae bacterium]